MKVSVIIPYTDKDSLVVRNAIQSVRNQTRKADEIFLSHDQDRKGPAWARNQAFIKATGDVILPLDADDTIEPTFLERTLPLIERPKVGIVSTAFRYVGDSRHTIIRDGERTYELQLKWNGIPCCSLVRREAIGETGGWFEGINGWEDWDLWIRILHNGWTHAYVDEILFNYTFHRAGMNEYANKRVTQYREIMANRHKGFRL